MVSPLEVVLEMKLFKYFPDIIAPFLPAPLYPPKIAVLLPAPFLSLPTPSPLPEEEQELTVEIIELFLLPEPLSVTCAISLLPTGPTLPSMPVERISLLHPAQMFVNELRLVPTSELNEQNIIHPALMVENESLITICSDGFAAVPTESAHLELTKSITNASYFCVGPVNPWSTVENVASATQHAIYWLLCAVYESIPNSAHQTLHAQVSTCPVWAFSTL